MDREVWTELGHNPKRTSELAKIIRASIIKVDEIPQFEVEEEFAEGKLATKVHLRRERSHRLRKEVIAKRMKQGNLVCDLCGYDGESINPMLRDSLFECHHIIPLSLIGETQTKARDIALLCANCHRLLHRAISNKKEWVSISEAKAMIFLE
ncbi:HNH endonuclease [Pseudomonas sp. DC3000-4b1]|uniref:HNH endonuclease n=1 Tax=unclassified Pseudomonas TaxID=196821 RepID=UPI003CFA5BB4